MNTYLRGSWCQQRFIGFAQALIFFISLSPISGFGHPAGDFYQQAVKATEGKHFQQAASLLQQAITEFPTYAEAHHLLGLVNYQQTQNPNTAIPSLKEAIKVNPNFPQAHYDLALLLLKQERIKEAQQHLHQATAIYPGFWEARLTLAKTFDQTGLADKAIQEYETVLKQEPLATDALFHLAYYLMQYNDLERAHELLTRLTTHDSQHTEGWYALGRLSERRQELDHAITAYSHVLQNDPHHIDAHYNLGFLYQQLNQPDKAIEHFQRVTQLNPTDAEAYFNVGVLFVAEKQFDQAEKAYQKGLELQPQSMEGQFNMGAFYEFHKEDLQRAKRHYQQYLDLGGTDQRIQQLMK